jgi:hypothetical protein
MEDVTENQPASSLQLSQPVRPYPTSVIPHGAPVAALCGDDENSLVAGNMANDYEHAILALKLKVNKTKSARSPYGGVFTERRFKVHRQYNGLPMPDPQWQRAELLHCLKTG